MDIDKISQLLEKVEWKKERGGGYEACVCHYRFVVRETTGPMHMPQVRPLLVVMAGANTVAYFNDPEGKIMEIYRQAENQIKQRDEAVSRRRVKEFEEFLESKLIEGKQDVASSKDNSGGGEDNTSNGNRRRSWLSRFGLGSPQLG
jgi:hypothetical protein